MAYAAWSVVFGEQPSAAKWNILGTNDASFNDGTGIGALAIASTSLANASVTPTKLATGATQAVVATAEATSSTSFADLATTTDTVTVTIGANGLALIILGAALAGNTAGMLSYMGVAISGASTVSPSDAKSYVVGAVGGLTTGQQSYCYLETGLAAGSTTFKAKYRVSANAMTASTRRITVIPL